MTVRIQKPAFNIREKLSELERPIGLKGSELMRAETAQEARDFVSAGRKNLIINGDMRIAQRGTSSTIDNNYGTVDRWFKYASGDTNTWGQAVDPVHGYYAYWKANSSGYGNLRQRIEGFHIPTQGITVTLSFWMKIDSGEAPLRIEVWNLTDSNNILSDLNIDTLTSSWKYYTITFNILSNVSLDTFHIMIGSNSAPAGTTFYLTKVQLEVGKNATEFEHRSYGEELALCQRYYQVIQSGWWATRSATGTVYSNALLDGSTITLPVAMRAIPTARGYGTSNGTITSSGYNSVFTTISSNYELYVQRQYSSVSGIVICNLGYASSNNANVSLDTSIVMLNTAEETEFDAEL